MSHKSRRIPLPGAHVFTGLAVLLSTVLMQTIFLHAQAVANTNRPNIIIILADDMGFSDLGCYGSEIPTPNLDRLAASGLRFKQFYNTPRCCPSRAALLTGLYPQEAGIGAMMEDRGIPGYLGELNTNCVTIAEALRPAGYHTLAVGKWHVSHVIFDGKKQLNFQTNEPYWDDKHDWPLQRGFENFYGTIHGVTSYYDPFSLVSNNVPVRGGTNFYYTDAIADHAVANINQFGGDAKPFFMYVAFTAAHWPLQAPAEDIARNLKTYEAGWDVIRSNRYERQIQMGVIDQHWPLSPRDSRVAPWTGVVHKKWEANRMATYAAMIERMDAGIGRIMAELKAKRIDRNTLVIFLADNGACDEVVQSAWYDVPSQLSDGTPVKVGNHFENWAGPANVWQSYGPPWANVSDTPFRLYKHFTHEGGISTPFIAHWPAMIQTNGGFTSQIGHITDLMSTCLDAAGVAFPSTRNGQPVVLPEGKSLLPVFAGQTREVRPLFWEHEGNRAVRLGKWKLVSRYPNAWELYDTEADRTELNDLAAKDPSQVKQMSWLYESWAKRCYVVTPDKLPPIEKLQAAKLALEDDPD
jgi:arylsulfatase A-like enzyme